MAQQTYTTPGTGFYTSATGNPESVDVALKGTSLTGFGGIPTAEEMTGFYQQQLSATTADIEKAAAQQQLAAEQAMYNAPTMAGYAQQAGGLPMTTAMAKQAAGLANIDEMTKAQMGLATSAAEQLEVLSGISEGLKGHVDDWLSGLAQMYGKTEGLSAQLRFALYGGGPSGEAGIIQQMSQQVGLWYTTGGQQGVDPATAQGLLTQWVSSWAEETGNNLFKDTGVL
jgi:uncharacterized protein YaiE (UPF0345 family)